MAFDEIGFDEKLERKQEKKPFELSSLDFDTLIEDIDAAKISKGKSVGDRLDVDYDSGKLVFYKNKTKRIEIGEFNDGKFGLRVYNVSGSTVVDQSA